MIFIDFWSMLQGLEWVLEMYYTGSCPDYRFVYDRQPPTLIELIKHLQAEAQKHEHTQKADKEEPSKVGETFEFKAS